MKREFAISVMVIMHIITNVVIQFMMAWYILSGRELEILNALIGFVVWLTLLCIDYFISKGLIKKSIVKVELPGLIHCADLPLVLPILIVLFVLFIIPIIFYPSGISHRPYDIILSVEIVIVEGLLVLERIILLSQN